MTFDEFVATRNGLKPHVAMKRSPSYLPEDATELVLEYEYCDGRKWYIEQMPGVFGTLYSVTTPGGDFRHGDLDRCEHVLWWSVMVDEALAQSLSK